MRLQLIFLFLLFSTIVSAQQSDEKKSLEKNEVDFLFSYYRQDGDNSAVTGGKGTEKLTDLASTIIVNVPVSPSKSFILEHGTSYYSSASSDNINPNTVSSASSTNLVHHLNVTTVYKDTAHNSQIGIKVGGTHQNNFGSLSFGGYYVKSSKNKNRELKVLGSFTMDKWGLYYHIYKLYPYELKQNVDLVDTDKRYSYNLSFAYKQVVTKRLQVQLSGEFIYQTGLLSTPFHRVYFKTETPAKVERLPSHRFRMPLALRLNYFVFDKLIIRSLYRFYTDDFGIRGNTINLELPYKVTNFFSVYPFYNFHTQTAARFFNGYKEHDISEHYYTSDYDLSGLNSAEFGAGFFYSPVYAIARFKFSRASNHYISLKKWETRYGYYKRSTGLHASIISTHFGFIF